MAGLAAANLLGKSGVAVSVLEARDRIGGRVHTLQDPSAGIPIELGAEFIHGRAPQILDPLKEAKVEITEVDGDGWCVEDGELSTCNFFEDVGKILDKMDDAGPDESFADFLERSVGRPKSDKLSHAKQHATNFVSGFNAADPALVGTHWLVKEMRAEEKMEGDRAFHAKNGYTDLLEIFRRQLDQYGVTVQTEKIVESVKWRAGNVDVAFRHGKASSTVSAPRVIVTLPISILKPASTEAGTFHFKPTLPREMLSAFDKLEMGKVIRVVLRFRERFWETIKPKGSSKSLDNLSFLFSQDEWFPTWWTSMPRRSPVITGWAPFRCAERLSGKSNSFVVDRSVQTLGGLLHVEPKELHGMLEAAYFHDWQTDPFSMGAYSYGKVGANEAQEVIERPVDDTLYFAGEATDTSGNNGTVHGAIESGHRAARQILRTLD